MKPKKLINALRKTDGYIEAIFMQGSCYRFYLFLKKMYPNATPYIHKDKDHIATKIGKRLYDINGIVKDENNFSPLQKEEIEMVKGWSFHKRMFIQIKECPNCEEPLLV